MILPFRMTLPIDRLQAGDVFRWFGGTFVLDVEHYSDSDVDDFVLAHMVDSEAVEVFPRCTSVEFLGSERWVL